MKINGQQYDRPKPIQINLPFGDETVTLFAGPVTDYTKFEQLAPEPVPPEVLLKGGQRSRNVEDPKFKKKVEEYGQLRTYWMVKESLKATPELEWDTVDDSKPDTWPNIEPELKTVVGEFGVAKIIKAVLRANGLSEEIVQQARDSFLASQSRQ